MFVRLMALSIFIIGFSGAYFLLPSRPRVNDEENAKLSSSLVGALPAINTSSNFDTKQELKSSKPLSLKKKSELPIRILHEVPFTPQAPLAEWDDPRQQDACEEASTLMVSRWVKGKTLNRFSARREILKLTSWELERFGYYADTSAVETAKILTEYFKISDVEIFYDVGIDDIRQALARGRIVIVPVDGQQLNNPYFTSPGPGRHMLVIVGYNDSTAEFITNDPGTKRGAGYKYGYKVLKLALREYPSGNHEEILEDRKAMISVGR